MSTLTPDLQPEASPSLNIAAVQLAIRWLDKSGNLTRLEQLLQGLPPVDLIVLPETFATGFAVKEKCDEPESGGEVLGWMKAQAVNRNAVVAGSILVEIKDKTFNRFYWVHPDGSVDYYDKRHLFRLAGEHKYIGQGNQRKIFTVKGVRVLPQVCYDLRFPVWSRCRNDYDLAIYIANWPSMRRGAWDSLLKARAIENQAFVIGVNRVGDDGNGVPHSGGSCVIDYSGNVLDCAPDGEEKILIKTLNLQEQLNFRHAFPFADDADEFEIL